MECGAGKAELSMMMKKEYKCQTTALDVSPDTLKYLENADYVEHVYSNLESIEDKQFDIIFCSHLLPFVLDFNSFFNYLTKLLKVGGVLFVEHNNNCKDYYQVQMPDHPYLYFFNESAHKEIAKKYNLSILDTSTYGFDWFMYSAGKGDKSYFLNDRGNFLRTIFKK